MLIVDSLVRYLEMNAPDTIAALRRDFPDVDALQASGKKLGTDEAVPDQSGHAALIVLARQSLLEAQRQTEKTASILKTRLRRISRFKLSSGLVSTLTGAGLIGAIFADATELALIGAAVTFLASAASLVAQYLEAPIYGKDTGPQALFAAVMGARERVTKQLLDVELLSHVSADDAKILAAIRGANQLIAEVDGIEMRVRRQ